MVGALFGIMRNSNDFWNLLDLSLMRMNELFVSVKKFTKTRIHTFAADFFCLKRTVHCAMLPLIGVTWSNTFCDC